MTGPELSYPHETLNPGRHHRNEVSMDAEDQQGEEIDAVWHQLDAFIESPHPVTIALASGQQYVGTVIRLTSAGVVMATGNGGRTITLVVLSKIAAVTGTV